MERELKLYLLKVNVSYRSVHKIWLGFKLDKKWIDSFKILISQKIVFLPIKEGKYFLNFVEFWSSKICVTMYVLPAGFS